MTNIREWEKLQYYSPEKILVGLRKIALELPLHTLPYDVAALRKRELREYGESRQCAIFCYGISRVKGLEVEYAHLEKSDFDFIARYPKKDELHYVPIQIKELVPADVNPKTHLEAELNKLQKYCTSEDLCVAVHLNRNERIDLASLQIPKLNIRELWFFGAKSPNQNSWWLFGNMLNDPMVFEFEYPTEKA